MSSKSSGRREGTRRSSYFSSSASDSDRRDSSPHQKLHRQRSRKVMEEEINDYLAKKAQSKASKVAKKKSQAVSGYSNDSNPFGDSSLNEKFVCRKKIERDASHGLSLETFSIKSEKKRQRERVVFGGHIFFLCFNTTFFMNFSSIFS